MVDLFRRIQARIQRRITMIPASTAISDEQFCSRLRGGIFSFFPFFFFPPPRAEAQEAFPLRGLGFGSFHKR